MFFKTSVKRKLGENIMISDEEKQKIKADIVEKINSVMEKNGESFRLDNVNILKTKETVKFMGNYRVYDRRNYDSVSREINSFLKQYGDVDIKSKKIRDSGMKFTTVSFNFELWKFFWFEKKQGNLYDSLCGNLVIPPYF